MSDVQLHLGDCLDILPTMAAGSIDSIVTDPPYCSGGRQQEAARLQIEKNDDERRAPDEWIVTDNMGTDTYIRFMRQVALGCFRVVKYGAHAYVFTDWRQYTNLVTSWECVGWTLRSVIVWDKAKGGAMGSFWRSNHEWICCLTKGKPRPLKGHAFYNTWRGVKPAGGLHPTEKPLELMRYLVRAAGAGVIFDPFMGSGTMGVACVLQGVPFIGCETVPEWYELARRRISETLPQPELVPDGL